MVGVRPKIILVFYPPFARISDIWVGEVVSDHDKITSQKGIWAIEKVNSYCFEKVVV